MAEFDEWFDPKQDLEVVSLDEITKKTMMITPTTWMTVLNGVDPPLWLATSWIEQLPSKQSVEGSDPSRVAGHRRDHHHSSCVRPDAELVQR